MEQQAGRAEPAGPKRALVLHPGEAQARALTCSGCQFGVENTRDGRDTRCGRRPAQALWGASPSEQLKGTLDLALKGDYAGERRSAQAQVSSTGSIDLLRLSVRCDIRDARR